MKINTWVSRRLYECRVANSIGEKSITVNAVGLFHLCEANSAIFSEYTPTGMIINMSKMGGNPVKRSRRVVFLMLLMT